MEKSWVHVKPCELYKALGGVAQVAALCSKASLGTSPGQAFSHKTDMARQDLDGGFFFRTRGFRQSSWPATVPCPSMDSGALTHSSNASPSSGALQHGFADRGHCGPCSVVQHAMSLLSDTRGCVDPPAKTAARRSKPMDMPIGQKPQCISNRAPQESHSAGALVVAQGSLWRHVCPAAKKTIRTAARLAPIRTTIRSRVALNACHQRETPDQRRPPEHGHVSVQKRSEAASLRLAGEPLLSVPPPLQPVTSSCLEQIPMTHADESYGLERPVRTANERLLPHDIREATSWPLVRPISLAADTSSFFVPPRLSVCPKPAR